MVFQGKFLSLCINTNLNQKIRQDLEDYENKDKPKQHQYLGDKGELNPDSMQPVNIMMDAVKDYEVVVPK